MSALSGMNPETRHSKTIYFQGAGTSKIYEFVSLMTFLILLLSYSKLKGSVSTKGCVFVMRRKEANNKKIIKVTTCEK